MVKTAKILVVDDEPDMVDILRIILAQAGFEVETAYSGLECLEKASGGGFDLILLDIRMPEMDGWKTLRKLKENRITDRTNVIILTVEKGPGVEIFGLQDVVFDYITKPFDKEKLVKRVQKALRG
ncbi:MAG: response regulator [Candidatus Altiarchaeales archaeon]|nr:response regulator [Candidatus Altiarchaeales archaeon]MBD3415873.1 response regulator [Candidatus Altiarchaeales archaeon]